MLTVFTTGKPFEGHSGIIQRNALRSWTLLHPDVEVILFGDEEGAAETCREFGLRHEPHVERTVHGTKYLKSIFERAQKIARHDVLCYCNCDILLTQDFRRAVERVTAWSERFLLVGRRWDTDIITPVDFSEPDWQEKLTDRAQREGFQRLYYNIDYFIFRRNLYAHIPPLVIGRVWWDHWVIWKARSQKVPVVDASAVVCAIHQNHDYSYHPQGQQGVWYDEGARRNYEVAGGRWHLHTMEDPTYRMTERGIEPRHLYWLAPTKRLVRDSMKFLRKILRVHLWHPLMGVTRPFRHALGLRRENLVRPFSRGHVARRHELDR